MITQQQDQHCNAGATEIHQLNPGGPDQRQIIKPQSSLLKVFRPEPSLSLKTGVQLKRAAKLLTVIGLTTKHAVCRITFRLYPVLAKDYFPEFRPTSFLNLCTKVTIKVRFRQAFFKKRFESRI